MCKVAGKKVLKDDEDIGKKGMFVVEEGRCGREG